MWTKLFAPALLAAFGFASSADAVSLDIQGGALVGASGVSVGGTLYDVTFGDGTCDTLFGGCDDASDLDFGSAVAAADAAMALLNQVFLDQGTPATAFGSDPGLTAGCSGFSTCQTFIPFMVSGSNITMAFANNLSGSLPDSVLTVVNGPFFDTAGGNATFAQFSPAATAAVPLPASSLLLAGAIFGIGGLARRRKS